MKTSHLSKFSVAVAIACIVIAVTSCNKEDSASSATLSVSQMEAAISQAIAVGVTASGDSIYVMNACGKGSHKDSVAASALPASTTTYLTGNYSGYTFQKAYTIKDTSGTLSGYVVIIQFNGKPVGLQFDASGNFVKVLEQREKVDIRNDRNWHHGGFFDNRDGMKRDTIALSSLSSSITAWFAANYPADTLVRAFSNSDSSIVVLSINGTPYATVFGKTGSFIKRIQLPAPAQAGKAISVEQASLPSAALTYLSATYPDYVFEHAFRVSINTILQGYVVFIDASNTKYAIRFDASGSFIKAITVR